MGAHREPMVVRRSGSRARRVLITATLVAVGLSACSDEAPSGGPGPVEPVGPIGPVGPVNGDDDGVAGSGELVLETRAVEPFDSVVLKGEGSVTISFGDEQTLTVETDDNLLGLIETTVRDRVLEISTADDTDIAPTDSVDYRITVGSLVGIELLGAGSIDVERWSVEAPSVIHGGAGDVRVESLQAEQLVVEFTGAGSVTIAGIVTEQNVSLSGVGTYEAADLESMNASIEARSAVAATVWATGTLDATVSDTGSVAYYGSPELTQQVDGLGEITSLGAR